MHASVGEPQTLKGRSGSVSYGVTAVFPGFCFTQCFVCALQGSLVDMKFDFKLHCAPPTVLLWFLLYPCMFFFFFNAFQHSPVNGLSATSCDFSDFIGEDEYTSFYPAISLIGGDQNHPQEKEMQKDKMVV